MLAMQQCATSWLPTWSNWMISNIAWATKLYTKKRMMNVLSTEATKLLSEWKPISNGGWSIFQWFLSMVVDMISSLIKYELATLFADSALETCRKKKSHNFVWDIGSSDEEEAEEEGDDGVPRTIEEDVEQEEMANPDESLFILKKGPTHCQPLSNAHLLCYYLPPGYSYAKYLSTCGGTSCEGAKSYFPYEYVDSLKKLDEPLLPYEAFFTTLCRGNTLDEDQDEAHRKAKNAGLKALWEHMGMTSLRDLLLYYNNCDVVLFLTALDNQCHLYKESGLDMLKDAPSLPGAGTAIWHERSGGCFSYILIRAGWPSAASDVIHSLRTKLGVLQTSRIWTYPHSLTRLWGRCACLQGFSWLWRKQFISLGDEPRDARGTLPGEPWVELWTRTDRTWQKWTTPRPSFTTMARLWSWQAWLPWHPACWKRTRNAGRTATKSHCSCCPGPATTVGLLGNI